MSSCNIYIFIGSSALKVSNQATVEPYRLVITYKKTGTNEQHTVSAYFKEPDASKSYFAFLHSKKYAPLIILSTVKHMHAAKVLHKIQGRHH